MKTKYRVENVGSAAFPTFAALRCIENEEGVELMAQQIGIAATAEGAQAIIDDYLA